LRQDHYFQENDVIVSLIATKAMKTKPKEIEKKDEQWEKAQQSHFVKDGQKRIVGTHIFVPDIELKGNSKSFSSGRVLLKSVPSFLPGHEPELPIGIVTSMEDA